MGNGIEDGRKQNRLQPRRSKNPLLETLVAIGVAVGGSSAKAEAAREHVSPPAAVPAPVLALRPAQSEKDTVWFREKLKSLVVSKEEFAKMERHVEQNKIPLSLQVRFVEATLQPGGVLYRDIHAKDLSLLRYSNILKLVDRVSTRMTLQYEKNPADPDLAKYFDVSKLQNANRTLRHELLDSKKKSGVTHNNCNGSFFVSGPDVYFRTAAHCVEETKQKDAYRISKKGDLAIQYVAPNEYREQGIDDPADLPVFSEVATTAKEASGRVVVTFGWGPDRSGKHLIRNVDFSFAMPLPEIARGHLFNEKTRKKLQFLDNAMIFMKPQSAGEVLESTEDIFGRKTVTRTGASGFSGEEVAVDGGDAAGYRSLGSLQSVTVLEDTACQLCYAIGTFSDPKLLANLIAEDRMVRLPMFSKEEQDRLLRSLGGNPFPTKPTN